MSLLRKAGIRVSGEMKDGKIQNVLFEKNGKTLYEGKKTNFKGIKGS